MAYIYGLRSKDSLEYFYIGSTRKTLEQRLSQHLAYIRLGYNKNHHLVRKVYQIGFENVVIEAIEQVSEESRFEREYQIINEYFAHGANLTNVLRSQPTASPKEESEFDLQPHHILAIMDAYEHGVQKTANELSNMFADIVFLYSRHIINRHVNDFILAVDEVVKRHGDRIEINGQADSLYKRVSDFLERIRRRHKSGL